MPRTRNHLVFTLALLLTGPALAGCIAGDASTDAETDPLSTSSFSVATFVQGLEEQTDAGLVSARVESMAVQFNQTRVTMIEWRSWTPHDGRCDLVTTLRYVSASESGGFLVDKEDQPCPLSLTGKPTVAETVALVDRVTLPLIQNHVLKGAPVFSLELAGYCAYAEDDEGLDKVFVWDGAGLKGHQGDVRCGGGSGSALTLAVTVPQSSQSRNLPQSYIILEQVPALT